MAASVSGSKTASKDASPALNAAVLTTLMGIAVENLKVSQLQQIVDALRRVSAGGDPARTVGSLL